MFVYCISPESLYHQRVTYLTQNLYVTTKIISTMINSTRCANQYGLVP